MNISAVSEGGHGPDSPKKLVERGYDKIASQYLEWTTSQPSSRPKYLQVLLEHLPNQSRVLELGCGAGVPGTQILDAHHKVIANDISAAQIELAKKLVPGASFIQGDMMSLDFPQRSFEAVVAFYSIIHLPREEQKILFTRIFEWLEDDGYFLTNLGTTDNSGVLNPDWLGSSMYWSSFDASTNKRIIQQAGFEVLQAEIVAEEEDGKLVPFLWVLAKKSKEVFENSLVTGKTENTDGKVTE